MKALQVTTHGRPGEILAVQDIELPDPGPGEVRVRVKAASLNFNDINRCRGTLVSVRPHLRSRWVWTSVGWSTPRATGPRHGWDGELSPSPRTPWAGWPNTPSPTPSPPSRPRSNSMTPKEPPSYSVSTPPTWPCSAGAGCGCGETAGHPCRRQRARKCRNPIGQGGRGAGDRRGRRTGQGGAVRLPRCRCGDRPHRRRFRRSGVARPPMTWGPTSSTTCPEGISRSGPGGARREEDVIWPSGSPTTRTTV